MIKLQEEINQKLKEEKAFVLVTIVSGSGSSPRGAGAVMAVCEDGSRFGTIGGGAVEFNAEKKAVELLKSGTSMVHEYNLAPNKVADLGMICGGRVTVHFQYVNGKEAEVRELWREISSLGSKNEDSWLVTRFTKNGEWAMAAVCENGAAAAKTSNFKEDGLSLPSLLKSCTIYQEHGSDYVYVQPLVRAGRVYIFGGGHISYALVPVLSGVFFSCAIVDNKEEFSNPERFPLAKETLLMDFETYSEQLKIHERDYVVIVTRGHKFDYYVLSQALKTKASYIGMIGSLKKVAVTYDRLIKEGGFTQEDIKRIHAPIGLPIGGETPEEIAISIAAELIQVRSQKEKEC